MSNDSRNLIDCHFYFDGYGCLKTYCPFRHCPTAKKTNEICADFILGNCTWVNCPKRHMHSSYKGDKKALERAKIKQQLLLQGFSDEDAKQASEQATDIESALIYLKRECGICSYTISHSQMFYFMTCEHGMCRDCAVIHFENQIKNNPITSVACPYPDCVNLEEKDEVEIHDYFSLLITQLKSILPSKTVDLLEKKLRDWSLANNPDFLWCPNCGNGMIIDDELNNNNYVECNDCEVRICPQCKKIWTQQHVGLTCDQFEALLENKNSLEEHEEALEKFLSNFGVVCPNCRTRFVKSSGGCLHFTCTICKYKFCEGCLEPFYNKRECPQLTCAGMGFHAHHPRNCFFYLRDWTPPRLQRLLASCQVPYVTQSMHNKTVCPIMVQKEKDDKLYDEECGEQVQCNSAGLCQKHYVQYLGWLILRNKIDPITQYSSEELEQVLLKAKVPLPSMSSNYYDTLLGLVRNLKQTGGLSNTTTISEAFAPLFSKENEKKAEKVQTIVVATPFIVPYTKTEDDYDDDDYYYDDDDDDDDEEIFGAAAPRCMIVKPSIQAVKPVKSETIPETSPLNTWQCRSCTYANKNEVNVCAMCCRTRRLSLDDYEITFEGIECHCCTLINESTARECAACLTTLKSQE